MREQPGPAEGGGDRPVSDPLAGAGGGYRRRLGDAGEVEGRGQGAVDRPLEFQRAADGAVPQDRAHYIAAAAVFGDFAGSGRVNSAVLPTARRGGDFVLADEVRAVDRQDDKRAGSEYAGGRFQAARAGLPGTAAYTQSGTGGGHENHWSAARAGGGRSGDRVGAAA